jgi:RNA polymerase sigma-70 factor (ECF subfamily)
MADPAGNGISASESSLALLARAKAGDRVALNTLLGRYRPRLQRWAHRRLPDWARDLTDTDDLVQNALVKTVRNLDGFVDAHASGLQSYLRVAVGNAIRDEVRRVRRRPTAIALDPEWASDEPSPLERVIDRRRLARYEAALSRLAADERDAVIGRLEFGFTHGELAAALGKATPDAARKLCAKAIAHLLGEMRREDGK